MQSVDPRELVLQKMLAQRQQRQAIENSRNNPIIVNQTNESRKE